MAKHPIVHIELSAKDRQKAEKFYTDVFGWDVQQMPQMNYATFNDGSIGGGFNPVSKENPAGTTLIYIQSDDIEKDLKKIHEAGGKIVMGKTEIPGIGWFGLFEDPSGNKLGLYTNASQVQS